MDSEVPADNIFNTETLKDNLRKILESALQPYKGKMISKDLLMAIQNQCYTILRNYSANFIDFSAIKLKAFSDKQDPRKINIVPLNIYTAMIINDDWIPYPLVEGKTEYTSEKGTYTLQEDKNEDIVAIEYFPDKVAVYKQKS